MRQAITTEYRGPTNSRGSRILVRAQAGRASYPWDHALNPAENHAAAARAYADRWGWAGDLVGGALPNGRGYAFVFAEAPTDAHVARALVDLYVCAEESGGAVDFEGLDDVHALALSCLGDDAARVQAEARNLYRNA